MKAAKGLSQANVYSYGQKLISKLLIVTILLLDLPFVSMVQSAKAETINPNNWVTIPVKADPMMQGLNIPANAVTQGMWSGVYDWPMNAIHTAVMPDGRLLSFGSDFNGDASNGRFFDIWNPALGFGDNSHSTSYNPDYVDSFCGSSTYLSNGDLLISGGNSSKANNVFKPSTGGRTTAAYTLASHRWYSTLLTLPDSRPIILGGMFPSSEYMIDSPDNAIAQGLPSMTPEIFESNGWRSLFGANSRIAFGPDNLRTSYPRAWVAPNGKVFGISSDKMWFLDPAGNSGNGIVTDAGNFKTPFSLTNIVNAGATSSAVMYAPGKILQVGGNGGYNSDNLPASNMATVVDINSGSPVLTEQPSMGTQRRYPNSIVLANGQVVITGGTKLSNYSGPNAVYTSEIWTPTTPNGSSGTWSLGASAAIYRGYHSLTTLLPNGAILSAGGGNPGPVTNLNAEIYYPPYLFKSVNNASQLATRPVIKAISGLSYANDADLQMDMESTASISQLVLIGVSQGTHSFNTGQRRIPLTFTQDSFRLTTVIPNANLTPPGYYQVVALDTNGVPSLGTIIAIGQGQTPPPVPTTPYTPPDLSGTINAPILNPGGTSSYSVPALPGVTYSWNFGDGSPSTPFSSNPSISHTYSQPGLYVVTLSAKDSSNIVTTRTFVQAVATAKTTNSPTNSSPIAFETRAGNSSRVWVVNPDNDSVSVIDALTKTLISSINVGTSPRTLAVATDGRIWVANKESATISIISPTTLAVVQTISLPRASQPHGIAFTPAGGSAYIALEATGQLLKLNPSTGAQQGIVNIGSNPRQVSITADGTKVLVSRFITPPLPGESTATINVTSSSNVGGEVVVVNPSNMTLTQTIILHHSDKGDSENQGSGIPNYLSAAAISPDGTTAWVPSKQDNIKRGTLRKGQNLDFQNTVRAISSRIDMATLTEDYAKRVDHDNSSVGAAAVYHPSGVYMFVALETSRQVAILDAISGFELFRLNVGRAPQGLAISPDGNTLFVQEFMDRSVSVFDLSPLTLQGQLSATQTQVVFTVNLEKLPAQVVIGKQLFYDAKDSRLARDSYMSCASCHNDAGQDGRVWDLTGFGEGLRNTIALKGRAGLGHGFLHWSANFDEVQDFEKQIRDLAGGTGLISDAQFNTGTVNQPLGTPKAGLSVNLDDLASYLNSLNTFAQSPNRNTNGTLTANASAGKTLFNNNCSSCHSGNKFSDSVNASTLKNIGTIKATSGQRLGAALNGIDVPTLRDAWSTAPYLHDGSAATIADAVQAHNGTTLTATDITNITAYVQQIGSEETASGNVLPTVSLTAPTANAVFTQGTAITISANAADSDGTVAQVQFFDGATLIGTDTTAPYSMSLTNATVGAHSFTAVATDNAGATTTSAVVSVTVNATANVPPTVSLTAPTANAVFTQGTAITISANAADSDGTVAQVQFFDGATLIGTDTTAPYSMSLTNATVGAHSFTAVATDNAGATTTSAVVSVTVNAGAPAGSGTGLLGQYFANINLTGSPVLQRTEAINFNWAFASPGAGVPSDNYSVRWSGQVEAPSTGAYQFQTNSDDGIRVYINNVLVIENWTNHPAILDTSANINLIAGQKYNIVVEYYEGVGNAVMQLLWKTPTVTTFSAIPAAQLYNATSGNVAPTVNLTAPTANAVFTQGTAITISANAADSDGTVAQVQFFDGATLIGTDTTAPYSMSLTNATVGAHSFTAVATDNAGATTTSAVVSVTVEALPNVAPTVNLTAPTANAVFTQGTAITISANAADSDGTVAQVQFFDGATLIGTDTTAPYSMSLTNATVGAHSFTAVATDNAGATTTSAVVSVTVEALPNVAPTVNLTAPTANAVFTQGTAITISANAADSDGTVAQVQFFDGATLIGTDTTAPYSMSLTNATVGAHSFTAVATDNAGATTTSAVVSVTVEALPNVAPTVNLTAPTANAVFTQGTAITISANAADSDGTVAQVQFFDGATLIGTDTTAPYSMSLTNATVGAHSFTAVATDNAGATTTSAVVSVTVEALPNVAPTVNLTAPTANAVFTQGTAITISANAADSDGTVAQVQFFDGATLIGTDTTAPYSMSLTNATVGAHSFTAVATDNAGATTTSAVVSVTVEALPNVAPTVNLTAPTANAVFTQGTAITISANAADSDGTVAQVQFFDGATLIGTDTTAPYSMSLTNATVGAHSFTAVATDNAGATTTSAVVSVTVEALPNVAPTVNLTAPTANAVFTQGTAITISANAADSDGTVAQVQFFDGATLIGTDTTAPYSMSLTNATVGAHSFTAVATDNAGATTTSAVVSVTVNATANVPPTVSLTAPTANAVFTQGTAITISANAADSDGTVAQVQFFDGATLIGTDTTAPYSMSLTNATVGAHSFTAVATDNAGATTTSAVVSVTVNAGAPAGTGTGLLGQYFANINLTGSPVLQRTEAINFNWAFASPGAGVPSDNYSVRWSGQVEAPSTGAYQFQTNSDDGIRVYINNVLVIENWTNHPAILDTSANINLIAGQKYNIVVEYYEGVGNAVMQLLWKTPTVTTFSAIPAAQLYNATSGNVAPTVNLTAPTANAVFTQGTAITISANAADSDGTVAQVQFFDGATLIGTDTTAPYSMSLTNATVGAHSFTAVATDNAGATTTSAVVSVTVNATANVPPTVSLTAPTANAVFTQGTAITISANAADSNGTVAQVQFFDGATLIGTDTTAPYSMSLTNATVGAHSFTAVATDNAGATTTSAVVSVTVEALPNVAPTVNLTAPTANAVFTQGTAITISANAADSDGTVAQVQFFDGATLIGTDTTAPYSMSLTNATVGAHSFTAVATDNAGATTTSAVVSVTVNATANVPPTVSLTAPTANAVFTQGTAITISANAADSDGTVAQVQFFDGATLIGTDTTAPYSMSLTNATVGAHSFTAVATDNAGATTTSAVVSVTVNAGAPAGTGTGLLGQYFANINLTGSPVLQRTEAINFNWAFASPGAGVPSDNYSVRWSGQVEAPSTGAYQFRTNSDDGIRVYVNNVLVINNWTNHPATLNTTANINLIAGQKYNIVVEYYEGVGNAVMQLLWKTPTVTTFSAIPAARLYK